MQYSKIQKGAGIIVYGDIYIYIYLGRSAVRSRGITLSTNTNAQRA